MASVLRVKQKLASPMSMLEVLGHLVRVEHGADREADLGGAAQRAVACATARG